MTSVREGKVTSTTRITTITQKWTKTEIHEQNWRKGSRAQCVMSQVWPLEGGRPLMRCQSPPAHRCHRICWAIAAEDIFVLQPLSRATKQGEDIPGAPGGPILWQRVDLLPFTTCSTGFKETDSGKLCMLILK